MPEGKSRGLSPAFFSSPVEFSVFFVGEVTRTSLHSFIHIALLLSRDMSKPTMWLYAQRRLRSAWASAQSDQSLRCALEETLGP